MVARTEISVIIATRGRAHQLQKTLEEFAKIDVGPIRFELVIVDNSGLAEPTLPAAARDLPVRLLAEPTAGKNVALNHALDQGGLGELVVFTDDDVSPAEDWLAEVVAASSRWPDHSVFGGRIDGHWPDGSPPSWARSRGVQGLGFGVHAPFEEECLYESGLPFGANFWVRREVLSDGRRFDRELGPRPTNRLMGGESAFLEQLVSDGQAIVYVPSAVVSHRISPESVSMQQVRRRAYRNGRSLAHRRDLPRAELVHRRPYVWWSLQLLALGRSCFACARASAHWSRRRRVEHSVRALRELGRQIETLRRARRVQKGEGIAFARGEAS